MSNISFLPSGIFVDLYELTMAQSYWKSSMRGEAVFELFVRKLPQNRNFLLAGGIESLKEYLLNWSFSIEDIEYLRSLNMFDNDFLELLSALHFSGTLWAVKEGTVVFANEPIVQVKAPIIEAQLLETAVINLVHLETVLLSKCARVVLAAKDRAVIDFGSRRAQGVDAALKAAKCSYLAGALGTSNLLAGKIYGIPVFGTMAHSYIQAHKSEEEAFRKFLNHYPATVLLIDTYDYEKAVLTVIKLSKELGADKIKALRLDSGNLVEVSNYVRSMLDKAGLSQIELFCSGGLDEYKIEELLKAGAPINGFGVGTNMVVSKDAPSLDMVYKLVEYDGRGVFKSSAGKETVPGAKQVFREKRDGKLVKDYVAAWKRNDKELKAQALLTEVDLLKEERLSSVRDRISEELNTLPEHIAALEKCSIDDIVDFSLLSSN